jgi:hypothetical protein
MKYSVPLLVSAQGEEAARRAMPTSSAAGFVPRLGAGVGAEALQALSSLPWRAAWGNKERLVSLDRTGRIRERSAAGRRVFVVAIESLAAPGHTIRLLFALSRTISLFLLLYEGTGPETKAVRTINQAGGNQADEKDRVIGLHFYTD